MIEAHKCVLWLSTALTERLVYKGWVKKYGKVGVWK